MKFKVYGPDGLLRTKGIIGSVFLNCIPKFMRDEIGNTYANASKEKQEACVVDIELKFNGVEVDPEKFFNLFSSQMQYTLQDTTNKLERIEKMVRMMEESIQEEVSNVDWSEVAKRMRQEDI